MTRKRSRPSPDDVACPNCAAVTWRRAGESLTVAVNSEGDRELHHEFAEGGPWNWTCEACGHEVRPGGALDNALSRAQPVVLPAIAGGLTGLGQAASGDAAAGSAAAAVSSAGPGSAGGGSAGGVTPAQVLAGVLGVGVVGVVGAVAAGALLGAPAAGPSAPPSAEVRAVDLDAVRVTRVTGDTTFWIDDDAGEILVVLDERRQPEDEVTVRAGDDVSITGTAEPAPPEGTRLSEADQDDVRDDPVYIRAVLVRVLDDEAGGSPRG